MTEAAEPDGPESLARYLARAGVPAEIIVPGAPTPTVAAAAAALGVAPSQIVKSLLFEGKGGDRVLVVAPGDRAVDRRKLSEVTGLRGAALATPEVVAEVTGYRVGGTPPVGHRQPLRVVLDRAVLDEPVVFGGGGRDDAMLRIVPEEIARLTGAVVADICREPA